MTTRITKDKRETIISRAAAGYRNSAKSIQLHFMYSSNDPIATQLHAMFNGDYAKQFVLSAAKITLGEERAYNLTDAQIDKLTEQAIEKHDVDVVCYGHVARRGLIIDRRTQLAEVQSKNYRKFIAAQEAIEAEYSFV